MPSAVGFTSKGGKVECSWVLKKEHLRLEEVAKLLGRINQEKKEWDRDCGRRGHDYFISNGSKVLVGSYTHLRKEGLEGYVTLQQHGERCVDCHGRHWSGGTTDSPHSV